MTTKTGFDEFCSSLINVHDNPPSTHVAEKLTALWVDEKDNTRKAILIDQLASLERNAWKCQAASAYRTQLRPVLKCFFDQESFGTLLEGSHQTRYAAVKMLSAVILTNDVSILNSERTAILGESSVELGPDASKLLSDVRPAYKLLWCRRTLQFLSKANGSSACPYCPSASVQRSLLDQPCVIDILFRTWTSCLKDILLNSSTGNDLIDLLVTSHDLITRDMTKRQASSIISSSWSSHGKPLLDLMASSNRLVIRHTMELLYCLLSNALHDLCLRRRDCGAIDTVATNILTACRSSHVAANISKIAASKTWFGGPVESDSETVFSADLVVTRLWLLLPTVARAALVIMGSQPFEASFDSGIPDIGLDDPYRLVSILLDQDDHFCDFWLSSIIIIRSYPDSQYNPHRIWLHFLNHVGWSDEVVIDWLTSSETVFLVAFMRYLKLILHDPASMRQVSDKFPLASITSTSAASVTDTDPIRIPVLEIIGDQERQRDITLKPLRRHRSVSDLTPTFTVSNVSDKPYTFFHQLASKLERMHKRSLIGFNVQPLINLLDRVHKTK